MIIFLRKKKGKLFQGIAILLIGVMGFGSALVFLKRGGGDTWVAKINGKTVGRNDYTRHVMAQQQQLHALKKQYGQYAETLLKAMGYAANPEVMALDSVTRETILDQYAHEIGMRISPDYIAQRLNDPNFVMQELSSLIPMDVLTAGGMSMQRLSMYLRRVGLSIADFEYKVEEALQRTILLELSAMGSYVPSFEVKQHYATENLGKKFSFLTFDLAKYVRLEKEKDVSQQELQGFFDKQNQDTKRYWIPEKRGGTIWRFNPKTYGVEVTHDDVVAYYDAHKVKEFIEKPAQIQVRRILFKIEGDQGEQAAAERAKETYARVKQDPASFAEVAGEVSDDKDNAAKGGLLPFFAKGTVEQAVDRAAFILKEDGDISDVIRTKNGYEILQRVGKKPAVYKPISAVEDEIKRKLSKQKFTDKFIDDMKKIVRAGEADDQALQDIIAQKKASKETIEPTVKDNRKMVKKLFELREKELDFYVEGDAGVAIKLTTLQKSHLPSLESIKSTVLNDLYEERATKSMRACLESAKNEAESKPLRDVQHSFSVELDSTDMVKKNDEAKVERLRKNGLPIEQLFQIEKVGQIAVLEGENSGFVVRLDDIEPLQQELFETKKEELLKRLVQERKRLCVQGFVASLSRNATIKINESLFTANHKETEQEDYYEI